MPLVEYDSRLVDSLTFLTPAILSASEAIEFFINVPVGIQYTDTLTLKLADLAAMADRRVRRRCMVLDWLDVPRLEREGILESLNQMKTSGWDVRAASAKFAPSYLWVDGADIVVQGATGQDPPWGLTHIPTAGDHPFDLFRNNREAHLHILPKLWASCGADDGLIGDPIYSDDKLDIPITFREANGELLQFLASHPEYLYKLHSRAFEEVVAEILKNFGYDVELTNATRDGGRDIIAHLHTPACSFIAYVECKRYAPENKVGIDVVQRIVGVVEADRANLGLIVTTSGFTAPALEEGKKYKHRLELRDYQDLTHWLKLYRTA